MRLERRCALRCGGRRCASAAAADNSSDVEGSARQCFADAGGERCARSAGKPLPLLPPSWATDSWRRQGRKASAMRKRGSVPALGGYYSLLAGGWCDHCLRLLGCCGTASFALPAPSPPSLALSPAPVPALLRPCCLLCRLHLQFQRLYLLLRC